MISYRLWIASSLAILLGWQSINSVNAQDPVQQEKQSMEFVATHHPELVALLQRLKDMNRDEYETAMKEILKVRKRIEALEKRDPELCSIELDAWKLQSQIDMLLARAVVQDKEFDRKSLQTLVEKKVKNQRQRLESEKASLAIRHKQIDESLERLVGHEQERVAQQLSVLLKKVDSKKNKPNGNKPTKPSKGDTNRDAK
ncbi:MAG: hypothetical protein ABL921_03120 [Pirellula sp.]